MQTFLPSTSYQQSAKWLDNATLYYQRFDVVQILNALTNPVYGWKDDPAVRMWKGYEASLIYYGWQVCLEWKARGYKDSCQDKILSFGTTFGEKPPWLIEEFASNHRSILLGKAFEKVHELETELGLLQVERIGYFINSIEEVALTKAINKSYHKLQKAYGIWDWYQSFNWSEKPAQRVNDKWPYLWPEKEN